MYTAKRRGLWAILATLAVGLFLASAVAAGDILEDTKARQVVEAQRVEALVREAERDAARLYRSRPEEAIAKLQSALTVLTNDTALETNRRKQLLGKVTNLLKSYDGVPARPAIPISDTRRAEEERRRVEAEQINRSLSDIQALKRDGRSTEANRLLDDLARRFPDNPAITAGRTTSGRGDALADNRYLNQKRNEAGLGAIREIERTAANVIEGDIKFPADWVERSKRRSRAMQITEKERAILKALNTPYPAEFNDMTFQDVIQYLEKVSGQPILIDKQALAEANVTYDGSKVTFNVRKASLRAILHRVLGDLGLTYIVKDEAIQVTSVAKARETLSARTYYVGDLVAVTDLRFGPVLTQLQMAAQVNQIANLILQTVEPDSWAVNGKGGLGTLAFDPVTMSFVARQTAEVHFLMGVGMR